MGTHERPSAEDLTGEPEGTTGAPRRAVNVPFALTPILLVTAVVAALMIINQGGQQPQLRTSPAPGAQPNSPLPFAAPRALPPSTGSPAQPSTVSSRSSGSSLRAAPALLGAPDFDGYCRSTGQGGVELVGSDAYGWHCSADNGTGDNAQAVCAWTFGGSVTNRVADFNNPRSWQCWRASRRLGAINFTRYCTDIGFSGARYVGGGNAYGWLCTGDSGGIDTQDACRRLYGSTPPISRFRNFYDRTSWECWG